MIKHFNSQHYFVCWMKGHVVSCKATGIIVGYSFDCEDFYHAEYGKLNSQWFTIHDLEMEFKKMFSAHGLHEQHHDF